MSPDFERGRRFAFQMLAARKRELEDKVRDAEQQARIASTPADRERALGEAEGLREILTGWSRLPKEKR